MLKTTLSSCSHARGLVPRLAFSPASMISKRCVAARYTGLQPGSDLTKASCEGFCDKDTPLVTKEDLTWLLPSVPLWKITEGGTAIHRKFTTKNFMSAMSFFNSVAEMAEHEGHHPDLHLTNYRDVEIVVSSHSAGGLTLFDFVLAAKLDKIPVEYSAKFLKEHGPA